MVNLTIVKLFQNKSKPEFGSIQVSATKWVTTPFLQKKVTTGFIPGRWEDIQEAYSVGQIIQGDIQTLETVTPKLPGYQLKRDSSNTDRVMEHCGQQVWRKTVVFLEQGAPPSVLLQSDRVGVDAPASPATSPVTNDLPLEDAVPAGDGRPF